MNWKLKVDGWRAFFCILCAIYAGGFFGAFFAGLTVWGFAAGIGWLLVLLGQVFDMEKEAIFDDMAKLNHAILDSNGELIAMLQTSRPFVVTRQGRELN